jgi:hypothetical protein
MIKTLPLVSKTTLKIGTGVIVAGIIASGFVRSFSREKKAMNLAKRLVELAHERGIPGIVHVGPPDPASGQPHPFEINEIAQWARGADLEQLQEDIEAIERSSYRIGHSPDLGIYYLEPLKATMPVPAEEERISGEYEKPRGRDTMLDLDLEPVAARRSYAGGRSSGEYEEEESGRSTMLDLEPAVAGARGNPGKRGTGGTGGWKRVIRHR